MMAQQEVEEVLELQINTAVFNSSTNQFLRILKDLKQSGTEWQMFNHCIRALKTLQLHHTKKKKSMWALPRCKYDVNANLYSQRLCANFHVQSYLLQFQSMWFCWMKIMNSGAINQIEERVTSTSDLHSANEYEMWKQ